MEVILQGPLLLFFSYLIIIISSEWQCASAGIYSSEWWINKYHASVHQFIKILVEDYLKIIKDVVSPLMYQQRVQVLELTVGAIFYVHVMKYSNKVKVCFGRVISMKAATVSPTNCWPHWK